MCYSATSGIQVLIWTVEPAMVAVSLIYQWFCTRKGLHLSRRASEPWYIDGCSMTAEILYVSE